MYISVRDALIILYFNCVILAIDSFFEKKINPQARPEIQRRTNAIWRICPLECLQQAWRELYVIMSLCTIMLQSVKVGIAVVELDIIFRVKIRKQHQSVLINTTKFQREKWLCCSFNDALNKLGTHSSLLPVWLEFTASMNLVHPTQKERSLHLLPWWTVLNYVPKYATVVVTVVMGRDSICGTGQLSGPLSIS
jgi:hypothetical protein